MALGWGETMADKTRVRGLAKWLILLALVPIPGLPLLAQSKDQPDQGFGPVDTSAPAMAPTQIIQGEDDPYGSGEQIKLARRTLPNPPVVAMLPSVGHAPHREARDATLELIRTFAEPLL